MSANLDSERLQNLRQNLGLSQRALANEFQVTPGALAMWEKGTRPIPGPVLKLIEIYEHYLGIKDSPVPEPEIRRVSADWSSRIVGVLSSKNRKSKSLQSGLQSQLASLLRSELSPEQWKRNLQLSVAERIVDSLGETKGLPMKIAQLASYADLSLPQEIRETLAKLQTMSTPMSAGVAARVFFEEIGKPPYKVFAEWDPKPFAAASIGQVHRARLKTGEVVAVKIQYPGIYESLLKDFGRIEIFQRLASLLHARDADALNEIRTQVMAECDYAREARNQEWFAKYFEGHPRIRVPKIYPEFSRSRVITQEYIQGKTLPEFMQSSTPDERQRAAMTVVDFFTQGFFLSGRQHADPHPGNFLFSGEKVCVLDFGRVVDITPGESANFRDLWLSIVEDKKEACKEVFRTWNVVRDWQKFDFDSFWDLTRLVHAHQVSAEPFEMTPEHTRELLERMQSFPQRREIRSPSAFLWSNCVHLGIWSVLSELRAKTSWYELNMEFIRQMNSEGHHSTWVKTSLSQ